MGVLLSSAQGPLVRSAWLGTGESRRMLSPQRPGGLPLPAQPGGLTEPLHRLGKQTLGGGSPPTPSRAAREGQWGGEPPVTEHAVRLSRQDPSPRPSPPLCRPLLLTNAGFGGVRRGNGKRSAQGLQCKGASAAARPHPGPRAPGREVGAGLDAEPSARAGVRWRSHAKLCHPGKTTASGRSQGCPAPGPGG